MIIVLKYPFLKGYQIYLINMNSVSFVLEKKKERKK